jgi:serine/threonine protein kinase
MDPSAGTLVARRFRLLRELGRGTMGTVWLADHETLGVRCAVKFTAAGAKRDPSYRERFEREARSVAQLDCPNVVRVLDYDVFEGVPFLAMEWLSGEDLESRLRRVRRLRPSELHRIVSQIAQGLDRAHAAGIIHRDLKPGNVFLAQTDEGEIAKILDFGLAKVPFQEGAEAMTQAGSVLGTPVYMSPEQARSVSEIDPRADLWSLAVIAYECLLGKLPFDGPSLGEVFARIMFEPIPVPSEVDPAIPRGFDRWWARAACREVERRFASAREMADALGPALGLVGPDRDHSSRGDLAAVRSVPPPRRKRGMPWLGATAAAILFLAGWQLAPRLTRLELPSGVRERVRATSRAVADSFLRVTPPPEAAATAAARPALPTAPASACRSTELMTPPPTPITLAPAPSELPVPPPTTPPPPRTASSSVPMRAPPPSANVPAARESPAEESVTSGLECRTGQHRCDGRVLQVCNDSRDGWTNVVACPEGAVCDATGSGRCASASPETHDEHPSRRSEERL